MIFTENTNSEGCHEISLLEGNDCLVGQIFEDSNLFESSTLEPISNVVDVESNIGKFQTSIANENFELLDQFEVYKSEYQISIFLLIICIPT